MTDNGQTGVGQAYLEQNGTRNDNDNDTIVDIQEGNSTESKLLLKPNVTISTNPRDHNNSLINLNKDKNVRYRMLRNDELWGTYELFNNIF